MGYFYVFVEFIPEDRTMKNLLLILFGIVLVFPLNAQVVKSLNGSEARMSINLLELEAVLESLQSQIDLLSTYIQVDTANNRIVITGANLQVVSGGDSTNAAINGLGNVIIGYNEDENYDSTSAGSGTTSPTPDTKTGSHNLIVGAGHTYSSFGGIVAGYDNNITAESASVTGGLRNTVSGKYSIVTGGDLNTAEGSYNTILGGFSNNTKSLGNTILGGHSNTIQASSLMSTISGGYANISEYAITSSTLGGDSTISTGVNSTILGTLNNAHLASKDTSFYTINTTPCIEVDAVTTPDTGSGGAIDLTITVDAGLTYTISWLGPNGFTSTSDDITGSTGTYIASIIASSVADGTVTCTHWLSFDL